MTVGAAASLVGVTVRALHHWDEIGLVRPSGRTAAGYRLYTTEDVARLHRVLVYRELGVSLEDIAALLDSPSEEAAESLLRQRDQLLERIGRLRRMADGLDRMAEARRAGVLLSAEEQVAIFGKQWQPSWAAEARERWGHTDQWAQAAERAAGRTPEDWKEITRRVEELDADLAAAKAEGVTPGSERANALAERHRASIGVYFDCTHSMHVCLGRMYAEDPAFSAHYNNMAPGLVAWLREVVDANARSRGVDPETAVWE